MENEGHPKKEVLNLTPLEPRHGGPDMEEGWQAVLDSLIDHQLIPDDLRRRNCPGRESINDPETIRNRFESRLPESQRAVEALGEIFEGMDVRMTGSGAAYLHTGLKEKEKSPTDIDLQWFDGAQVESYSTFARRLRQSRSVKAIDPSILPSDFQDLPKAINSDQAYQLSLKYTDPQPPHQTILIDIHIKNPEVVGFMDVFQLDEPIPLNQGMSVSGFASVWNLYVLRTIHEENSPKKFLKRLSRLSEEFTSHWNNILHNLKFTQQELAKHSPQSTYLTKLDQSLSGWITTLESVEDPVEYMKKVKLATERVVVRARRKMTF